MVPVNQLVNKVGKFLYKNIDGREKINFSGNMCDVYITVYYQIPANMQNPEDSQDVNDVHEMLVNINIATYQNKLRVNTISVTPSEKTLGYDLFQPEEVQQVSTICQKIYTKVCKRLMKEFKEFDFLF